MEEEIEFLDLEIVEPDLVKKRVNSINNIQNNVVKSSDENEKKIDNETISDNKKNKTKKKLKRWEKWFIALNIVMILGFIGLYLGRAIYYYNKMNVIKPNDKLVEVIVTDNNITYTGDGLYAQDDFYYYRGKDVNNYVYYSGRLFRIVSISDSIKLISNEIDTSLVWGYESNYQDSYINKWLNNEYYNSLTINENDLSMVSWCNNFVDINNYSCNETIEENVGLLTTEE